jgi:GT2 family glycosyltransferase
VKPGRVAVAILSWNGRQHLETCLAALREQKDPGVPWEILVLDNGSTDGSAEWLRREHPAVRLVVSPVNLGFCAGNNRLMRETEADAVALLNNDTRPRPDWLAALVDAYASAPADVAAVSGMIVDWEGTRLDFARGLMTFDGHALQEGFRRPLAQAEIPAAGSELLFPCGGNVLLRRESFLQAGGFDESFFAYYEDVDLGWRLWSGGERVVFTPAAVVHHRSSATSDLLGLYNRGFLFERNAFLTAYKNYESALWDRMMPAILLTFLSRTQSLVVENNPGGAVLTVDPYAGHIANTAAVISASVAAGSSVVAPVAKPSLIQKWQAYGTVELARRALRKAWRSVGVGDTATVPYAWRMPTLTDERTQAQFRVLHFLLGHLGEAASARRAVQRRRARSDREIFQRFPLALVATYPGDARLFADPGFAAWLPDDLPLRRAALAELMDVG